MAFDKETRQRIVREFAIRHNGQFDPSLFLSEVEESGAGHEAHSWFTWDDARAAREHRLWQAREFARDLRVVFQVEEVGRNKSVRVREAEMPLVLSPMEGRSKGGGYQLTDPANPAHMSELCRQAAGGLRTWLRRYQAAVIHAGGSAKRIESEIKRLDEASKRPGEEGAA